MAVPSLAQAGSGVTVGVDTHKDVHVAAAFTSDLGRPLGHLQVPPPRPAIANSSGGLPVRAPRALRHRGDGLLRCRSDPLPP